MGLLDRVRGAIGREELPLPQPTLAETVQVEVAAYLAEHGDQPVAVDEFLQSLVEKYTRNPLQMEPLLNGDESMRYVSYDDLREMGTTATANYVASIVSGMLRDRSGDVALTMSYEGAADSFQHALEENPILWSDLLAVAPNAVLGAVGISSLDSMKVAEVPAALYQKLLVSRVGGNEPIGAKDDTPLRQLYLQPIYEHNTRIGQLERERRQRESAEQAVTLATHLDAATGEFEAASQRVVELPAVPVEREAVPYQQMGVGEGRPVLASMDETAAPAVPDGSDYDPGELHVWHG